MNDKHAVKMLLINTFFLPLLSGSKMRILIHLLFMKQFFILLRFEIKFQKEISVMHKFYWFIQIKNKNSNLFRTS